MMIKFNRWCLYNTLRTANVIVNLFGAVMIVYSLWLLKKWVNIFLDLPPSSDPAKPWFILVCLGIGIAVCLMTLSGHMVAHCMTKYILAMYIFCMASLLLIQAAVVVTIYFKVNWEMKIAEYFDEQHKQFKNFILFHLIVCRLMAVFMLAAQSSVIVLAIILWGVGADHMIHNSISSLDDIHQSFLDYNSRPIIDPRRLEENSKHYEEIEAG